MMMNETKTLTARDRVLNTAEMLFHLHGYQAVTMRDIANDLGMKQASLYYHVPNGKEQLFTEITMRRLQHFNTHIEKAIADAAPTIEDRLTAVTNWIISQPPMKLLVMFETDMPALSTETQQQLMRLAYQSLFSPITRIFAEAQANGEIRHLLPDQLAGTFLSLLDGIMYAHRAGHTNLTIQETAADTIDMMLNGLRSNTQPTHKHELSQGVHS